jgi:hypothetical protein
MDPVCKAPWLLGMEEQALSVEGEANGGTKKWISFLMCYVACGDYSCPGSHALQTVRPSQTDGH